MIKSIMSIYESVKLLDNIYFIIKINNKIMIKIKIIININFNNNIFIFSYIKNIFFILLTIYIFGEQKIINIKQKLINFFNIFKIIYLYIKIIF